MAKTTRGRPTGSYTGQKSNTLGGYLGNARAAQGLGLAEVAAKLGVTLQFISNIEHGRAPLPAKYVTKIAKVLGVPSSSVAHLALTQTKAYRDLKNIV